MFRESAGQSIRSLAASFYKSHDIRMTDAQIDEITDAILDDIIAMVAKNPDFISKRLHPEVKDQNALLDKLVKDVMPVARNKLARLAQTKESQAKELAEA